MSLYPDKTTANTPSDRIRTAYDADFIRSTGRILIEKLSDHFAHVQTDESKVLNWEEPVSNINEAKHILHDSAWDQRSGNDPELSAAFGDLIATMLGHGQNLHNPRYIGHQVPASMPIAGWFDAVSSATNQVMAIYEMGPWATSVERAMIDELGAMIGWPAESFSGVVTSGGSIANLTALLTARNVSLPGSWETGVPTEKRPALIVQADSHYAISRSAGILGLGTDNIVKAPLDERRRMDPVQLDQILIRLREENRPIVAVACSSCATPIGAFDPLDDIATVCERHDVWMHVDAAHGGSALFSTQHRDLLRGIDRADSVVWDAHKMMFVPALCAFVFYRKREHQFETFRQNAPYLFDPSRPGMAEYDSGTRTLECTKRAATFGLWGVWSLFGRQLFEDLVDSTFGLCRQFYEKLTEAEDFQTLHEPQCNIVVFRYQPNELNYADVETINCFQQDLRRNLIQSGRYYIVQTTIDGVAWLRATVINPLTTEQHLDGLIETIREMGRDLMAD